MSIKLTNNEIDIVSKLRELKYKIENDILNNNSYYILKNLKNKRNEIQNVIKYYTVDRNIKVNIDLLRKIQEDYLMNYNYNYHIENNIFEPFLSFKYL